MYFFLSTGTRTQNHFNKMKKEVGMLLQKSTDTRGVGISSMRKSIYLLKTTPSSHTHRFHPLPLATPTSCSPHPLATPIHSTHSPQLSSILLTLHKFKVWMTIVESGWNLWVWLLGVVLRRYIDFLILLIPTPLVSVLFCSSSNDRPVGWGGSGGSSEPPRFDSRSGGPRLIIVVRSLVYALRLHVRKAPGAMRIAIYVMCGLCPCYNTCAWLRCTYTATCVARCNPSTAPEWLLRRCAAATTEPDR